MGEKIFDYIVLTVSNELQKAIIKEKIEERKKANLISKQTEYIIIIEKEKVGSGGAVFNLIKYFEGNKEIFRKNKILLIFSAGDSKRFILYADKGKICTPTLKKYKNIDGIIFDDIIIQTIQIGKNMSNGLLVASGDCAIEYKEIINEKIINNTAISVKADLQIGQRHGVFVTENKILKKTLQKNTEKQLITENAVDENNEVDIDTGLFYLNADTISKIQEIVYTYGKIDENKFKKLVSKDIKLNFYTDFIGPLSEEVVLQEYLNQKGELPINKLIIVARKKLWRALSTSSLDVLKLKEAKFIHYGTMKEFINEISKRTQEKNIIINSQIEGILDEKSYIENSYISEKSIVGKNAIIIDSKIENCSIPENIIIKTIKIEEKYVTIILGIDDNLKEENKIRIFNRNIKTKEKTLWECKLFTLCNSKEEAINKAIKLYNDIISGNYKEKFEKFSEKKLSIKEMMNKIS